MSMSIPGDSRRPTDKIVIKAVATGGANPPDDAPDDTAEGGTDKAPVPGAKAAATKSGGGAKPGTGTKPGARKAGSGTGAAGGSGAAGAGGKAGAAAKPGTAAKAGAAKAAKAGGRRPPIAPINIREGRNWVNIAMYVGSAVVAVLIIGFVVYESAKPASKQPDWRAQADAIPGINDYLKTHPEWYVTPPDGFHRPGVLTYPIDPPAGGIHNPAWQNCMGDVYPAQIPKEQATHSLEHGAVWVTYRPDLSAGDVAKLADKVRGRAYLLMSPYPGQDQPISLQAWGYQLKLSKADDPRIDQFIAALRQNAAREPQAACSGGITDTSTKPLDLAGVGMQTP
jgi:hypothetical protein